MEVPHKRETDLSSPTRIYNYKILSELGRGSFGVVYKAVHAKKGGSAVAIKLEHSNVKKPRLRMEQEVLK
jgi:serine/threonine protein kinase